MKPFSKRLGALQVRALDVDDSVGPVLCEILGCDRMALERVTMAGHPAGHVCSKHAREWVRLWADVLAEPEPALEIARAA